MNRWFWSADFQVTVRRPLCYQPLAIGVFHLVCAAERCAVTFHSSVFPQELKCFSPLRSSFRPGSGINSALRFKVPMRDRKSLRLSMNRKIVGLHRNDLRKTGSWSRCMRQSESRLSMNRKNVRLRRNDLHKTGSWSRCTRKSERRLSMNLTLVGSSRCADSARATAGGTVAPLNAARTAQRAVRAPSLPGLGVQSAP